MKYLQTYQLFESKSNIKFVKKESKKGAKTETYDVVKSGEVIGQIRWSSRMRGYAFLPEKEHDGKIKDFIKSLMSKRKRESLLKEMMEVKESEQELFYVFDPKDYNVIGFNITSKDELNNLLYDDNGYNLGYGWGLQVNRFDSLEDAQRWNQEKMGDINTKQTQNSKYPDLSYIASNLRKIDGLDYDTINRGSCFKFAKEISDLGYNTFTFIFSNEEQEVVHVYIKLNNNLYFDATGFHSKKEIKEEYISGEDNDMYDSDISELDHYCNLDTYSSLTTIPISNQLWKKVVSVINKSRS
jgi:hypothetical protein